MRWMLVIVGVLCAAPGVGAQDNAQKLYEAMEQKFLKAKACKIGYELEAKFEGEVDQLKGALILAEGNRVKLTFEGTLRKKSAKANWISDGKNMSRQGEFAGKQKSEVRPVGLKLYDAANFVAIRAGLFFTFDKVLDHASAKEVPDLKLSNFKTIGKDKVGARDATVIEYEISRGPDVNLGNCKLWLDAQTNVPLKRVLESTGGFHIVETYTVWELDPQLAEGTFTLPK